MNKLLKSGGKILAGCRMRSGETIVEVLMALFIVATGSATATALIVSSIQSNAFSRDNLIALNLAVEGLESVRNIRDSNWLKFGYDKTNCWNMMPTVGAPPAPPTSCTPDDLIKAGNYTASLDTGTMAWNLSSVDAGALNLRNEDLVNDQYILYFKDINPAVDSDGDGNATNDKDMYIAGAATNPASSFYRMITISYPAGTPNPPQGATEMTITSLVQWKTGEVHQIRIQTKLTNYQKVKVS